MIEEIEQILLKDGIQATKFERVNLPSGQKIVYYIDIDSEEYVLKLVDVTPQILLEEPEHEYDKNIQIEIALKSYRIIEEIKMSKKCPNFPRIKEINNNDYIKYVRLKTNGRVYLIYIEERVEGTALEEILVKSDKEYSINEVIDFLVQMVNHIRIMSSLGYVHRDIKPSNIIVDGSKFNLIDGGICKDINANVHVTATGMKIGTDRYLPPEQEKIVKNCNWTFQTDLYPLGIIATEMMNLKARKMYTTDEEIRDMQIVKGLWLDKDDTEISQKVLKRFINTVLNPIKALRFNTIDECINELDSLRKEVN